jgi:hypothetical protein
MGTSSFVRDGNDLRTRIYTRDGAGIGERVRSDWIAQAGVSMPGEAVRLCKAGSITQVAL